MSEEPRSCNLVVNPQSEEISISGLTPEDLTIEYGSDIDLTDLVMSFAKLIDTGESVSLEIPDDIEDEKVTMVLATIEDMAKAYNTSLEATEPGTADDSGAADEDDIPF